MTPPTDALGGYHALSGLSRVVGDWVFVGVLLLTAVLERLQFQLRATEASRWWASNGRDVVNVFALATMGLGLRVIGFSGPMSFLLAAALVVVLTGVQGWAERWRHATLVSAVVSFLLGAPILWAPRTVDRLVRHLITVLFP